MNSESYGEGTRAVHLPAAPVPDQVPIGLPVFRTAAFVFGGAEEYAELLAGTRPGYSYSRIANPTSDAFSSAVAALEGFGLPAGAAEEEVVGTAFASGMAAISAVLLSHCRTGSHVVAQAALYGGTYEVLTGTLARYGVTTTFVDGRDVAGLRAALRPETTLLYAETIANPSTSVPDLPAWAAVAAEAGVPFVVDSTFATPAVCRPLEHGADIVVHSATKYLGGHGDATGGVAVGRRPAMTKVTGARTELGGALAPDEAFLLHRGLATLPLRMARHCATASMVAEALCAEPGVRRVEYPGLPASPDHAVAARLFDPGRFGGIVTVTVPGGRAGAADFCGRLRLAEIASSLGSHRTKVSPIAATTHRQLDDAALAAAGVDPGAVRISVGLEDAADLAADLRQALAG